MATSGSLKRFKHRGGSGVIDPLRTRGGRRSRGSKARLRRARARQALRGEHGTRALGVGCDGVDVLRGRDLERESLSFHAIHALGAVLLGQENANVSCSQTDRDQLAVAFMLAVEREPEDMAIPRETASNVGDGEGGAEVWAIRGGAAVSVIVGSFGIC